MDATYEVVVIGAGLAGLTAALFCARNGYRTLVLDRSVTGNQIINAEKVENYPGFPQGISGADLISTMAEQIAAAGAEVRIAEALGLRLDGNTRVVSTDSGEYASRAVIIAAGSSLRILGIPGEEEFRGAGISTCATCDGLFFEGQVVGVVGGGDSALDEALTLAHYASEVLLFHRGNRLSAQRALQDRLLENPKVRVIRNTVVKQVMGEQSVTGARVQNTATGEESEVALSALFVLVGLEPNTAWVADLLSLDATGHIEVDLWMRTTIPGVFAAGDVRRESAAQIVSAAGDGATAALAAHQYLASLP